MNIKDKLGSTIKKIKHNDTMLKLFVAIFILGYAFFFASNVFFPKIYKGIEVTNIGKIINMEEYIFTLDAWDYSKDDNAFEIIFDVQNLSLEKKPEYNFIVKTGERVLKSDVHKNIDGKLLVVRVYSVPKRWTEATLNISAGDKAVRIGMNDKISGKVDNLKKRSDKEYFLYSRKAKIKGLNNYIKLESEEVKKLDGKLVYAYEKINELEKAKKQQTAKEQEITNNNIMTVSKEMEDLKGQLDTKMINIDEAKSRIKNLEENIKLTE